MRLIVLALLTATASASAQGTKTPATTPQSKQEAKAPATNTQVKQQDTKTPATKAPDTKTPAPAGQRRPGLAIAPETTSQVRVPVVMREAYDYDAGGRRDPFFSLLATTDLRPSIADLKLTGVAYHPTRPIAVMREAGTNIRYTVTLGTTLGRMRVVTIKPKIVIFTIEEFGLNRLDSLVLGDTTKARAK